MEEEQQVVDVLLGGAGIFHISRGGAEDEAAALVSGRHAFVDEGGNPLFGGLQDFLDLDVNLPTDAVAVAGNHLAEVNVAVLGRLQGVEDVHAHIDEAVDKIGNLAVAVYPQAAARIVDGVSDGLIHVVNEFLKIRGAHQRRQEELGADPTEHGLRNPQIQNGLGVIQQAVGVDLDQALQALPLVDAEIGQGLGAHEHLNVVCRVGHVQHDHAAVADVRGGVLVDLIAAIARTVRNTRTV